MLLIAIGGMAGALARFFVSRMIKTNRMPVSTIAVNLVGAFLLGVMAGRGIGGQAYLFAGTGFLGAFTTFSTLNVDLVKLLKENEWRKAIIYFTITYAGGGLCIILGISAGRFM